MAYFTNDGFVISGYEIFLIIFGIIAIVIIFRLFDRISRYISKWTCKSDDYPGPKKFADSADIYQESRLNENMFSDVYREDDLYTERRERVIFEEIISDVRFRYDEKTKLLTIGESYESSTEPIKVKLNSLDDLREFVDRLEEYVNE
jgi:hypothetical protein